MSAIRKLASQTAIYGLSSIIGRIAVWGLTPLFTAKMERAEYGIFNDLYSFVTYFLVILTFGMETAFFRFGNDDKTSDKPYSQSLIFVTALGLLFVLLFTLGAKPFGAQLGYADRPWLIMMVVWITFFDVITALPMAKLRYDERPIVFASLSLFNIFITIALNLFFILGLKETSAEYVFLANLIASVIKFLLLLVVTMPFTRALEGKGKVLSKFANIQLLPRKWEIDKGLMRSMAGFGLYIMLAGLFGMINQNSDVNFITRMWPDTPTPFRGELLSGEEMAGVYSANKKLAVFILLVSQAFRYAAEPFFFRHASQKKGRVVFAKVFHYFMLASLAVFLLISTFAYEFVSIKILGFQIIDEKYWRNGLAVVAPLLFGAVLWGAYTNLTIWYKLTMQVRFGILFSALGVVSMVVLFAFMIPAWGYMGAAYAMIICYAGLCAMVYFAGQRYYYIPYRMGRILAHTVIYVGAYLVAMQFERAPIFSGVFFQKLLICGCALGLSYGLERFFPIVWKEVEGVEGQGARGKGQESGGGVEHE
jgi:O-antigen/teichoic acid export membrane protein